MKMKLDDLPACAREFKERLKPFYGSKFSGKKDNESLAQAMQFAGSLLPLGVRGQAQEELLYTLFHIMRDQAESAVRNIKRNQHLGIVPKDKGEIDPNHVESLAEFCIRNRGKILGGAAAAAAAGGGAYQVYKQYQKYCGKS